MIHHLNKKIKKTLAGSRNFQNGKTNGTHRRDSQRSNLQEKQRISLWLASYCKTTLILRLLFY